MTHPEVTPQRRAVDQGPFKAFRAWWERWGGLTGSIWLFIVTAALLWVAVRFQQSQSATSRAAKVACQRARQFGPRIADDYERRNVISARELASYRASIPKRCPDDPR